MSDLIDYVQPSDRVPPRWPLVLFVSKCIGGAVLFGAALGLIAIALTVMSGWR